MTRFRIEQHEFSAASGRDLAALRGRLSNWPVVYLLNGTNEVYVGESRNAAARLQQHWDSGTKQQMRGAQIVVDDTFNKSACLDLESYLIRLLAGDGRFEVVNRNEGVTDADYYDRASYQETFREIFEELRSRGFLSRPIKQIENSDLFKLSPFKALTSDQAIAVDDILSGLFDDLAAGTGSRAVIQGDPGTGKTVVAIYLMKLLSDIKNADPGEPTEGDSLLGQYFIEGYAELLKDFRIGLVVPQQSLRSSIKRVFRKTPGLRPADVFTPFEVGSNRDHFDLLIVDEAHRLNQRANQAAGPLNKKFRDNNVQLFGRDDPSYTQLDWINEKSTHQLYLVDGAQSVRPADLPESAVRELVEVADARSRRYRLTSQMRVRAGQDYVGYVRGVLAGTVASRTTFEGYDLRFFDDVGAMHDELRQKEAEGGLARLLAGFAWRWASKNDPSVSDIVLDGVGLRWNSAPVDWVNSPGSADEVGSIHTIQGYDLNYAGVIIGRDLRLDPITGRIVFDRSHYFDPRGTTNNRVLGITYSDDDILAFVRNIYAVLLTRGVRGTFVYVCDPPLREHLRWFFQAAEPGTI